MLMTPDITESPGLATPTGRFGTWLIWGESELARGVRARGWDFARRRWRSRDDVTPADRQAVQEWLHQELNDIFKLAAEARNPVLREEAFRVRAGVGRPQDVNVDGVVRLLILLYRTGSRELLLEQWEP